MAKIQRISQVSYEELNESHTKKHKRNSKYERKDYALNGITSEFVKIYQQEGNFYQ